MRTNIVEFFHYRAQTLSSPFADTRHPAMLDVPLLWGCFRTRKRTILRLVACIETDAMERERWFSHDAIAALDGRTAEQMLIDGEEDALMAYLSNMICQDQA